MSLLAWLGLAAAVVVGFLVFSGILPEEHFPLILLGALAGLFLLRYPEIALALLIKVGKYKGDERVASTLPFDPLWLFGSCSPESFSIGCFAASFVSASHGSISSI